MCERERERGSVCVCVCVYVCLSCVTTAAMRTAGPFLWRKAQDPGRSRGSYVFVCLGTLDKARQKEYATI